MPQSIGQPLRRKEDLRLVTGGGRYSDDVSLPGQAYAYVLRSPHAHARIRGIATAAARAMRQRRGPHLIKSWRRIGGGMPPGAGTAATN